MAIELISLGAGVQSSAMALMAAKGLIKPMPVAAIFADTQGEPQSVYKWLDWLEKQLPFPTYRVTYGDLQKKELITRRSKKSGRVYRSSQIPSFTLEMVDRACSCVGDDEKAERDCVDCKGSGRRQVQSKGILPRKCTRDFKIYPVLRKARELAGVPLRGRQGVYARQWIGISTDEVIRIKPSREPWSENRWPLIEMKMSRADCLIWMQENGYPKPPRSACVFCPYHSDAEWVRLKTQEPKEFARAIKFEKQIQKAALKDEVSRSTPFLHSQRIPLETVTFDPKKGKDGFGNECEGMCVV